MDLFFNTNPRFTKWLVGSGALHEPFVVVDVGVLGGENPRWHFLGDHLVVHGFDAIKEVIDDLAQKNAKSRTKTFHWFAIGNEDGERKFFFKPSNPTNSSFYEVPDPELQARTVPVRRLDTLLVEGVIPKADFLKVDVEGHERDVFWGARDLLAAGVLGVESETSFGTSVIYPETHLGLIQGVLLKHGLVVVDLNFNRVRRAAYQEARRRRSLPALPLEGAGKPATFNVLFCRDLAAERNGSLYYEKLPLPPGIDQILKVMAIYELHGLNDIAVDTAVMFANELGQRLDVERAIDLLCAQGDLPRAQDAASPSGGMPGSIERQIDLSREHVLALESERAALKDQINRLHASTSWRITAPLRTIKTALKRSS
jgi:FkbM family methyltransferase